MLKEIKTGCYTNDVSFLFGLSFDMLIRDIIFFFRNFGLEYDDIPYNDRTESLGTPPIKCSPSVIKTPSGYFKVTESEKEV